VTEDERWRRIHASDRLLDVIERWRLCDGAESPVPVGWLDIFEADLGVGRPDPATISDLYELVFGVQDGLLKGDGEIREAILEVRRQRNAKGMRATQDELVDELRAEQDDAILEAARRKAGGTTAERG
jgi:hypothetical protein